MGANQNRDYQKAFLKAGILKLGLGTGARVAIKLRDDVKLAGYITEATEGSSGYDYRLR